MRHQPLHPSVQHQRSRSKSVESFGSHLRDLNSRPTVYEDKGNASNFGHLSASYAPRRADEALGELARGGHEVAGELLTDLFDQDHPGATHAMAEVAAGRWASAIELFRCIRGAARGETGGAARRAG
jgi:hypothetical protein